MHLYTMGSKYFVASIHKLFIVTNFSICENKDIIVQSNLVIRNVLIRNKLVSRNHFRDQLLNYFIRIRNIWR